MTSFSFEAPFEVKFLAAGGKFSGYASVFDVTDKVNDRIAPGAFQKSLQAFRAQGRFPPLLWQHDASQPIGAWRGMHEDRHGLFVEGDLFVQDIARAKEAYKLLQENVVTGLSIGYRAKESHREEKTGVRVLTEVELLEISVVTFPANDMARIDLVKSALHAGRVPSMREFEAFLRDAGFSRKQAKEVVSLGYKSLLLPPRDAEGREVAVNSLRWLAAAIRNLT